MRFARRRRAPSSGWRWCRAPTPKSVRPLEARGQMLVVRDRGPGVPESERERIFHRYEQGRPSPYSQELGLGLGQGLYIARSSLERMGGTIRAQNHPAGGAMFICTLPGYAESTVRRPEVMNA